MRIFDMAHLLYKIENKYPNIKYMNPSVGEMGRKPHEQIHQSLDMSHTFKTFSAIPLNLQLVLTKELQWLKSIMGHEYQEWKERPRY